MGKPKSSLEAEYGQKSQNHGECNIVQAQP